jgi:hypothetical protein
MKRSPGSPRIAHCFPQAFERQIQMYALAASAAGVGLIALTPAAEAKIVYTPANQSITGPVDLDLNHDGITELTITRLSGNVGSSNTLTDYQDLYVQSRGMGVVWGSESVSALPTRVLLGNNAGKFRSSNRSNRFMATWQKVRHFRTGTYKSRSRGNWRNVTDRYMGIKFSINGQTHYGWARLTVKIEHGISATLTGYAYETVADKPILIGNGRLRSEETSVNTVGNSLGSGPQGLGSLALGAQGRAVRSTATLVGNR